MTASKTTKYRCKLSRCKVKRPLYNWLRFVNRKVDLIERGRGSLLVEEFRQSWTSFRGRAIEPGASEDALLVGVSLRGFDANVPLDVELSAEDLIDAWRA